MFDHVRSVDWQFLTAIACNPQVPRCQAHRHSGWAPHLDPGMSFPKPHVGWLSRVYIDPPMRTLRTRSTMANISCVDLFSYEVATRWKNDGSLTGKYLSFQQTACGKEDCHRQWCGELQRVAEQRPCGTPDGWPCKFATWTICLYFAVTMLTFFFLLGSLPRGTF